MKSFWKNVFPGIYGLLIYFTIRLLLDSVTNLKFWNRDWLLNSGEMATSVVMGYLLVWAFKRLFRYFDAHWGAVFSYKRIAKELWYVFLVNLVLVNAIGTTLAALTDNGLQWFDAVDLNTIPLLYAIIYYGIVRSSYFLQAYIRNKIQLEKMTNDQLQTELKFLKAQYHPHFLFNALNTVYFQMDENVLEAKKSIEKFSELLRYQLYDQQQTVSVSRELQYLDNFIELQKTRASEKIFLDVQFDSSLNGQQVYPLLFLPLVENAFKYVGGQYQIRVQANRSDAGIRFSVENSLPDDYKPSGKPGIGLENLKRRLELLYPGRHQFTAGKTDNRYFASLFLETES
jgi:hypothetical protein